MVRLYTILLCVSVVHVCFSSVTFVSASDGVSVPVSIATTVTGPDGVCKRITHGNAFGATLYVPTTSLVEWASFVAHPPSGTTLGSCGCTLPWGGLLSEGAGVTAWLQSYAGYGSCYSEARRCSNGTLSGSYANPNCTFTQRTYFETYSARSCGGNLCSCVTPGRLYVPYQPSAEQLCRYFGYSRLVSFTTTPAPAYSSMGVQCGSPYGPSGCFYNMNAGNIVCSSVTCERDVVW